MRRGLLGKRQPQWPRVRDEAVREIVRVAFEELGLHRVRAETLLHNVRSQRVLERNGFVRFGMAPRYLNIAGRWQDHAMYQVVNPSWQPAERHRP